ncbi:hypothetical protein F2Q70_00014437 [Brassica cretica]|uniref:Uncharacterized protein n=1 Tax=Brassica cretica TaxID=69181 RepID=A0A8S9I534_BRACR|nr:hypothetical protein F2Q70_00014437 [Brassica cretica]
MEMCNRISATYRERIMQGWAVCANGGIFIPGSSLPNWVSFKNETHLISFVVPETLNPDPVGFTLWTPYVSQQDNEMSGYSPKITVKNQTKRRVWSRNPATDQIRMYREKHIWQGHFSNVDFVLETGDQVEVSVDFGDQVTILETGLTLTYREETSDKYISTIGYEVIPDEQLAPPEEKVDDEPITEASQSRPRRKKRMGFEKLMSVCCLRSKNEKDEEKDARMEFVTR